MSAQRSPSNPAIPEEAVALVCDRMLVAAIGKDWRQRAPEAVTAFWMDEVRAALQAAFPMTAQQSKALAMDGWVNVADGLPQIDEPVWAAFADGGCGLFVRAEADEGWAWCNTYGNVDAVKGKWIADDAEFDDDYQPTRWHRLPSLASEVAEVPADG